MENIRRMKNILVPDDLHYRIKVVAVMAGITSQEFTEAALVAHLPTVTASATMERKEAPSEPVPG